MRTLRGLLLALVCLSLPAVAQEAQRLRPDRFLPFALSAASLADAASQLAAERDIRPEVKAAASETSSLRARQLDMLRVAAAKDGVAAPTALRFEHAVALDNLRPLEHLGFARRYAELMLQILAQEDEAYAAAAASPEAGLAQLGRDMQPLLGELRRVAEKAEAAVR